MIDQLHGASIFSKVDLQYDYHQLKVKGKDVPKVAFLIRYMHYEFWLISFGLTNALATFYHLSKANVVGDALSRKSSGSLEALRGRRSYFLSSGEIKGSVHSSRL